MTTKDKELLEEAARRYPVGTSYIIITVSGFDEYENKYTVDDCNPRFWSYSPGKGGDIFVESGKGLVYSNGKWAPIAHPSYCKFKKGDIVVRWRDIEDWEWGDIGEVTPPPIGKPVKILNVSEGDGFTLPSIYLGTPAYHYPTTAFVLEEHYKSNRGTAELNTTDYGKDKNRVIEVQRPSASIVTGERRTGSTVQGRGDAAIVRRGHSRHKTIFGI